MKGCVNHRLVSYTSSVRRPATEKGAVGDQHNITGVLKCVGVAALHNDSVGRLAANSPRET